MTIEKVESYTSTQFFYFSPFSSLLLSYDSSAFAVKGGGQCDDDLLHASLYGSRVNRE